jgi:hypothetical protein
MFPFSIFDPRSSILNRRSSILNLRSLLSFLLGLASLATAPGCNRGPQFADVEGTVTLNGRPLPDMEVVFLPDPDTGTLGPASSGYTNEKGHYQLVTNKGQVGAVVGTHRVCIRDLTTLPTPPLLDAEGNRERAGPQGAKPAPKVSRVPAAYSSSEQTPLRAVEVKPGGQTLDFPLGSDKKK